MDAAYLTEPYLTEAEQGIGARFIADADTGPECGLPIAGYTVTDAWFHRYPRTAAAFARVIDQANRLAAADPAVWRHAVEEALHAPPAVAAAMASGTYPPTVDPAQLQRVADLLLEYGQLRKPFSVEALTG